MKSIADELITRGWCKGAVYDNRNGHVCLLGAALCAAGWSDGKLCITYLNPQLHDVLARAVELVDDRGFNRGAPAFNDDPATTFDDVLRAAKLADELLADG